MNRNFDHDIYVKIPKYRYETYPYMIPSSVIPVRVQSTRGHKQTWYLVRNWYVTIYLPCMYTEEQDSLRRCAICKSADCRFVLKVRAVYDNIYYAKTWTYYENHKRYTKIRIHATKTTAQIKTPSFYVCIIQYVQKYIYIYDTSMYVLVFRFLIYGRKNGTASCRFAID